MPPRVDLNLLVTLDVLLDEGSVTGAAKRLNLSPSAMSRALARLRQAMGDPLLVRAGRGLVPTPRAIGLRGRVGELVDEALAILQPLEEFDAKALDRIFTLRTGEGFVETFGPGLLDRIAAQAPNVRLRFMPGAERDSAPLREAMVDLETGVAGSAIGPEFRVRALYRDRFIGAVRKGHALSTGELTPSRYAAAGHVTVHRRHSDKGPVDRVMEKLGLERRIVTMVAGFSAALVLARRSDLVATVPDRSTAALRADMHCFELPIPSPEVTISLFWHPRMDADPANRWLRQCIREVCAT